MSGTLRVRITDTFVPDFSRLHEDPHAVVGRKWVVVDGVQTSEPLASIVAIPHREEFVTAIKAGDLIPADKETADVVGVLFAEEPTGHIEQLGVEGDA